MERNLQALTHQCFDVLVIGGGIHGACVAWEASSRGLSTALVEKSDFGSSTSANSLKIIHGGLRYLQTADFKRMRQSIRERKALMQIAPHLVHPLPVLIPTYGHGLKGKEAMAVAFRLNDLISCDRNYALNDPQKHIPCGRILSREACLDQLPHLSTDNLTGGALFCDAQVYNSERLVLAFLQSAAQRGATIANYVEVTNFLKQGDRITGVTVQDQQTGDLFDIQSKTVINTTGPWLSQLIDIAKGDSVRSQPLAKAMNLITRPVFSPEMNTAIGLSSQTHLSPDTNSGSNPKKSDRLLFIAPWRKQSLIGTWYAPYQGNPADFTITEAEIQNFLDEVNTAYPTFQLTLSDVSYVHAGLLPSAGISTKKGEVKVSKQFQLLDHCTEGLQGLLSVSGVKYTTARDIARRSVNWVFQSQGKTSPPSTSHKTPLVGGQIEQFDDFLTSAQQTYQHRLNHVAIKRLVYNYGSAYTDVLQYLNNPTSPFSSTVEEANLLAAEIKYGIRHTMAQTLSDIVFRRTEIGSAGHPGIKTLQYCVDTMGKILGWGLSKQQHELRNTQQQFERHGASAKVSSECSR